MTSDNSSYPERLTKIDALTRGDHSYLREEDNCLFLGEYTARKGYSHSATNNLIINFKKPMDRQGRPEWPHKARNIRKAAAALHKAFGNTDLQRYTFVPIPPSKSSADPMYDNRMMEMLTHLNAHVRRSRGYDIDIRELVRQTQSTAAAHDTDIRPTPAELARLYRIEQDGLAGVRDGLLICDDVLTTGCHFRAMEHVLSAALPGRPCYGVFLARRTPEAIDVEDFDW